MYDPATTEDEVAIIERKHIALCLNFVQGGGCYATGDKCVLGEKGASAKNVDRECPLHGKFDVWVMKDNRLLISDLGPPSEEPKQCLPLGVRQDLAKQIAGEKSRELGAMVLTTERRCLGCGRLFWYSDHENSPRQAETGRGYFCSDCLGHETEEAIATKLGNLGYWCG